MHHLPTFVCPCSAFFWPLSLFLIRIADAEAEGVRLAAELEHLKAEEARDLLQTEVSTPPETS